MVLVLSIQVIIQTTVTIQSLLNYSSSLTGHHHHNSNNNSNNNSGGDIVASLKSELERCLVSNKIKRQEAAELKEEMRKVKKEMLEFKQRCERAELLSQEQKVSYL